MRQRRDERESSEGREREPAGGSGQFPRGRARRALRDRGGFAASEQELRAEVEQAGDGERDDHEGVGGGIGAELGHAVEDLDRSHGVVPEHERGAEFGERPDEHDAAAGEEARTEHGERDASEPLPRPGAGVSCGFEQGRVDVAERRDEVEVGDRVQVQSLDHADAPEASAAAEPVDRGQPERAEDAVQQAVMSEELLESERADERRQDHRRHHHHGTRGLAGEIVLVVERGERDGDQEDEARGHGRDRERVQHALQIQAAAENLAHDRRVAALRHDREERQEEEQREEGEDREREEKG